ncbi:MAG: leucyl aminopeptidase [Rhodospirillales bacterium]|nr:leucyl aminopeptidase [Rhodospirillales bacterium]MDH3920391.1 leucyl aminopeptidase [Rhodospirillales bacterium]MDH3969850.1 leucyl aminopeptidase [Rhodospirillales bacterium]
MKISFASLTLPETGALAVTVAKGRKLLASAAALDKATGGALKRAMAASRFKGDKDQLLEVLAPPKVKNSRIVLLGVGEAKDLGPLDAEKLGGALLSHLNGVGEIHSALALDAAGGGKGETAALAAHAAYGAQLRSYRFDRYRTKEKPEKKPSLKSFDVLSDDPKAAKKHYGPLDKIAGGVFLTRDLVSEPANVIYPKSLAARAKALEKLGVKVSALGVAQMKKLGMGALVGVGQGSERESQLLVMEWSGAPAARNKRPFAFVGKGVTFDTGGISIKPAGGMEDMKWDMGGAGVVIGVMRALAARKAKANVVGVCGLVENMPSGTAQRPGDIVTSMSGQTIEVLNTDAEGRLVLADALWYAQEKFKPRAIVDLATLTGAIIVALGNEHAGLFANDDELSERLTAAGKAVGEPVWRLPLGEAYDKLIDSDAADMKNIGNRSGGSITAAQFLQRFVKKGTPWAHLDIAGVTWSSKDQPTVPKGGTAFGVRLLDRLIAEHYER